MLNNKSIIQSSLVLIKTHLKTENANKDLIERSILETIKLKPDGSNASEESFIPFIKETKELIAEAKK